MRIGEIIETMSTGFVAESFELNRPPALGSLVVAHVPANALPVPTAMELYAVVTYGRTVGLDPSRRAVRRSTDNVFDQEIYQEHPELQRTLRTEFGASLVGFITDGLIRQHLPSQPPPLHFSVQTASVEGVRRFTDRLQYLRLLLPAQATSGHGAGGSQVSLLQVLAANVRQVYEQRGKDRAWLDTAAREIATLLKSDHEALLTVLYAIEPVDSHAPSDAGEAA
ncbi:MAG: hypothetical protein AMJ93_09670 [Anaerolineae bacterium SM23_84]|nr:MAG: hypothetical protein AMJ93_09670 [Anaerolineae bacterium SM23_84]